MLQHFSNSLLIQLGNFWIGPDALGHGLEIFDEDLRLYFSLSFGGSALEV